MEDKIIKKIKALLKKTQGANCSKEEAQAALIKAQELIEKYSIKQSDLKDIKYGILDLWAASGKVPIIVECIIPILIEFFYVQVVISWGSVNIVRCFGTEANCQLACEIFRHLLMIYENLYLENTIKIGYNFSSNTYYAGLTQGLINRLTMERGFEPETKSESKNNKNQLVRIKIEETLNEELRKVFPDLKINPPTMIFGGMDGILQGIKDSEKIILNRRLE
jgi:hypothetical protein